MYGVILWIIYLIQIVVGVIIIDLTVLCIYSDGQPTPVKYNFHLINIVKRDSRPHNLFNGNSMYSSRGY